MAPLNTPSGMDLELSRYGSTTLGHQLSTYRTRYVRYVGCKMLKIALIEKAYLPLNMSLEMSPSCEKTSTWRASLSFLEPLQQTAQLLTVSTSLRIQIYICMRILFLLLFCGEFITGNIKNTFFSQCLVLIKCLYIGIPFLMH